MVVGWGLDDMSTGLLGGGEMPLRTVRQEVEREATRTASVISCIVT